MKKYKVLLAVSLVAIGLMTALVASINEKKDEQEKLNQVPKVDRWETKNEEFRNTIQDNSILGKRLKNLMKFMIC